MLDDIKPQPLFQELLMSEVGSGDRVSKDTAAEESKRQRYTEHWKKQS